jgi:hypothetical protein
MERGVRDYSATANSRESPLEKATLRVVRSRFCSSSMWFRSWTE